MNFQDIELEKGVLGCCFISGEIAEVALEILRPEDFFDSKNELVFRAIQRLSERGSEISTVALVYEMNLQGDGGSEYITQLTGHAIASSSMRFSCERLRELSIRRKLNYFALNIPDLSARLGTLQEFIEAVDVQYNDVLNTTDSSKCRSVDDMSIGLMRQIDAAHSGKLPLGIRTFYSQLDDVFRFMPSRYYVFAARTSIGKTTFALAVANNIATSGVPVLYFSLEMNAEDLTLKLLGMRVEINPSMAQMGRLNNDGLKGFIEGVGELKNLPLYIDDRRQITMTQIRIAARRMKRKKNIGIIFIDHLTQIKHAEGTRDYRLGLNQVSNDIYALAAELDIPIVVLAQIGRIAEAREDKRPRLADIKESGKIEEDCDLAIGLYREDYYKEIDSPYSTLEATIIKNRHGKSRVTSVFEVDKSTGRVTEKGQKIDEY